MLSEFENQFYLIVKKIYSILNIGNIVLFNGNRGSATNSKFFTAELVGCIEIKRLALIANDLISNCSIITSISNGFDYKDVLFRQIEALGNPFDFSQGIPNSLNTRNILKAIEVIKQTQIKIRSLVGNDGGDLLKNSDLSLLMLSNLITRMQEEYIFIMNSYMNTLITFLPN